MSLIYDCMTLTLNPRRLMVMIRTRKKVEVRDQLVRKIEWKRTDGPDRSHYQPANVVGNKYLCMSYIIYVYGFEYC